MKKLKNMGAAIGIAVLCAALCGCSHLDSLFDREVKKISDAAVRTNVVFETNMVLIAAGRTNAATGEVVPAQWRAVVQPIVTYEQAPAVYVTNLVPRASIEAGAKLAGALPVPWAGTVALGLGWLYSAYASIRNKQVSRALVQSVQVGREFLQSTAEGQKLDKAFRDKLERHQEFAGVADQVSKLLKDYVPGHTSGGAS